MKCPFCNAENNKVIDSRPTDDGTCIRRRRECMNCKRRFTTYEKLETLPLMVIKKDMSREPYSREKIEHGVMNSCHKRSVSAEKISKLVDDVENELFAMGEREIPTSVIGGKVMEKLKDLDEVAYVRFASVYREFKDVNTFVEEISNLLKSPRNIS